MRRSATGGALAREAAERPSDLSRSPCSASLLGAGAWLRDFALRPEQCLLAFAAAIATQWLGDRWRGEGGAGALSAVITALSLSLLLRADGLWAHPLAAIVAVGAKFVVRVRGKHLFNPGNLGVIVALVLVPRHVGVRRPVGDGPRSRRMVRRARRPRRPPRAPRGRDGGVPGVSRDGTRASRVVARTKRAPSGSISYKAARSCCSPSS